MNTSTFESYSTVSLKKRKNLSKFALYAVWIGGLIGILASLSKLVAGGSIESTTLVVSLIAIMASIPVYLEKRQIAQVIKDRVG